MELLATLVVGVFVIWLVQVLLGALKIKEPASEIFFVVTIVLVLLWMFTGHIGLSLK